MRDSLLKRISYHSKCTNVPMVGNALNKSCWFLTEKVLVWARNFACMARECKIGYHRELPPSPDIYLCLLNLAGPVFKDQTSSPKTDARSLYISKFKCNNVNAAFLLIGVWINHLLHIDNLRVFWFPWCDCDEVEWNKKLTSTVLQKRQCSWRFHRPFFKWWGICLFTT